MAISTNTFTINASYSQGDMITQLESAFTWLGWHDQCNHTGIVTGVVDFGMYQLDPHHSSDYNSTWADAEQYTSSGVGTDASFLMRRYYGNPTTVYVNRTGYGYTNGEYLEFLPGEASSSAAGGIGWGVTVYVDNSVAYGTTTNAFYTKNVHANLSYPYGILRHKIQDNKKYGVTYRAYSAPSTTTIEMSSGPSVHPKDWDLTGNGNGPGDDGSSKGGPRLAGDKYLDCQWDLDDTYGELYTNPKSSHFIGQGNAHTVSSSNSYQLDLNVWRSGLDPKFVVLSYRQPTLSSTKLRTNTFLTFIPHNFTTDVWDLDNVWLGGVTIIEPYNNETYRAGLDIITYPYGNAQNAQYNKRCGESPYDRYNDGINSQWSSNLASGSPESYVYDDHFRIYNRDAAYDVNQNPAGSVKSVNADADYNAVIKGIPLNAVMVPSPYNMPDDFAMIDFDYASPSTNIQQGDTITVSGSEVWTVITGSYNQTTRTRGILFCARKV